MRLLLLLAIQVCALNAEEWTVLFDGKTLNGWEARATHAPPSTGDWKVENGAILCGGETPGWLATKTAFKDFHLQLEFRGAATVGSGVFIRSQEEGNPSVTGYEVQIGDLQRDGYRTGSLVRSVKAQPTKIKADQWNNFDITAKGDHFLVKLNDQGLLDAKDSKHAEGVIGFQCQANQHIEFRNIRIKAEK